MIRTRFTTIASVALTLVMLISMQPAVQAQTAATARASVQTASGVQSPAEFLGYELGERFTFHHRMVAYFEHVAANSDYIALEHYGTSTEGRPLMVVYISAPENLNRLEDIRVNNLRRTGLVEGDPDPADQTAILWMSYNIHGNEAASIEGSMQTVYELANPANRDTKPWLENTLVIMDPSLNPDGTERYAVWFNQVVGRHFDPHPLSREHREPSPNGRLNHYHFDMNRDWAWQTQRESQLRNAIYQRWLPHVHADFHEMGGYRYFFAPAANPFHTSVTDWQKEFQTTIGENHARHFDAVNHLYYTGEVFDLFYPSYGDTWPTFQGAIGMTYEQGGSWGAGLAVTTPEDHLHTLEHRLGNQHRVGMSTVEVVARNHDRVAAEFQRYFDTSRNDPQTTYKTYILRHDGNRDNLRAMLELLEAQQVQFGTAPARRNLRAFNYQTGATEAISTTGEDIIVSMYQPKSVLANVLLEPRTTVVDSLTYDITAWSLPYVYGVTAFATTERLNPEGDADAVLNPAPQQAVTDPVYAYIFPWQSFEDARFLARLHREEFRVRLTSEPMQVGASDVPRGSIVITRHNNDHIDGFDDAVQALSAEYGRTPIATGTGLNPASIDVSSESVAFARAPRVVMFTGEDVSGMNMGEVWHFFDWQLEYPITLVDMDRVGQLNFFDFDVMVLPAGRYNSLLTGTTGDRVSDWLSRGGRLIVLENVITQIGSLRGVDVPEAKSPDEEEVDAMDDRLRVFGERRREGMSSSLAGGIFRTHIDVTHPLGFGMPETYYSLKRRTDAFEYLNRGWNVGHIPADGFTSGFVGYKVKPVVEESLNFGVINVGRGQVILMVDNPLFRGFWYSGRLLFSNAVLQNM